VKISKRSATRVDLSGGTLDCWPLHLLVDGCVTINLSVSVFTHVHLEPRQDGKIDLHIRDLNYQKTFSGLAELLDSTDDEVRLVQKHVAFWRPEQGFRLETGSESPVGGGLGGSSSLSISLIKAFSEWRGETLGLYETVTLSANLEAQVLHKMTGTQDYYPAVQPGLNAIHYTPRGARLETLKTDKGFWDSHLSLVYTGQPHHSGLNNWQVIKAALNNEPDTMRALRDIRDVSWDMYRALKESQFEQFPSLFDREFEARVRLSSSFQARKSTA
jgi:D-glycero-alpha-D-manno-heptose-7-phosphate kinase